MSDKINSDLIFGLSAFHSSKYMEDNDIHLNAHKMLYNSIVALQNVNVFPILRRHSSRTVNEVQVYSGCCNLTRN
jgi:hypothetical protein